MVIDFCWVLEIDHIYRAYSEAAEDFVFVWPYLYRNYLGHQTLSVLECRSLNKNNVDVNRAFGDLVSEFCS